jgi:hypothetical protein
LLFVVGLFRRSRLRKQGFFLGAPGADGKPKPLLRLVYAGGLLLAVSTVVLGLGLIFNG